MIKHAVVTLLLAGIILYAPWRLMVLTYYVFTTPAAMVESDPGHTRYWDAQNLQVRLERLGWTVEYASSLHEGVYGGTTFHTRSIQILDSLSWNARFAVLAHEGGHTLQPGWANHGHGEAFAETVAALVTRSNYRNHARYLARVRGDYLIMIITDYPALYRAASMLEDSFS